MSNIETEQAEAQGNGAIAGVPVAPEPYQATSNAAWNQQAATQAPPAAPVDLLSIPGVADLLAQARNEEKDKLYGRLEELGTQVTNLSEAEQARKDAAEEAQRLAAEAAEQARQAELSLEERVTELNTRFQAQEQEWQQRFESQQAIFEQERRLGEVSEYRIAVLNEHGGEILPELMDLVRGNTREEIDMTLQDVLQRTQSILGNVRQVLAPPGAFNPSGMPRGAAVTAPSLGPLDEGPGNVRSLTAQDIAAMSPDEYARHREQIMGELSRQVHARGGSPYQS